jgi:translation elongation factor EF-4
MGRNECGKCEHRQHGVLRAHSTGSVSIPQEAFIAALRRGEE